MAKKDIPQVKLGDTVIYHQPDTDHGYNGSREHPAIVTRVWDQGCINVTVFPDCAAPFPQGSVQHEKSENRHPACNYWTAKE